MKTYTFLLFDADNTLFDFHAGEKEAFCEALCAFGIPDAERLYPLYHRANDSLWKQFERGEIEKSLIFKRRFSDFAESAGITLPSDEVNALYKERLSEKSILMKDAEEVIKTLSARGYRLFIITNGDAKVQTGRFSKSPLTPYFEKIFISEVIGYQKPSPKFFEAVAEAIPAFDKKKALVIGDSETSDVAGANLFGIDACHMAEKSPPLSERVHAAYTIHALEELYALLP